MDIVKKVFGSWVLVALILMGLIVVVVMNLQASSKINTLDAKYVELKSASEAKKEHDFKKVDKDVMQSVSLASGKTYYGNIIEITDENIILDNVYYLRNPEGQDISLVKLGCELERPEEPLHLPFTNVERWENLKDETDGNTIPGAVKAYQKMYPDGQKCENS